MCLTWKNFSEGNVSFFSFFARSGTSLFCKRTLQTLFVSTKAASSHHTPLILPCSLKFGGGFKWEAAVSSSTHGSLDGVCIILLSLMWSPEAFESGLRGKGEPETRIYQESHTWKHSQKQTWCTNSASYLNNRMVICQWIHKTTYMTTGEYQRRGKQTRG